MTHLTEAAPRSCRCRPLSHQHVRMHWFDRPSECRRRCQVAAAAPDTTFGVEIGGEEKTKRRPLPREDARARAMHAITMRHHVARAPPRGSSSENERGSSPGFGAASLAFPVIANQWLCERSVLRTRYSGGAAPVFHRLPCPALLINCLPRRMRDRGQASARSSAKQARLPMRRRVLP